MNMETKDFYSTSDLNIATTLLCLGYDVSGINPVDSKRVVFYFDVEKFPDVAKTARSYWDGGLRIDPREFVNNRRELLTRIRESQREFEEV